MNCKLQKKYVQILQRQTQFNKTKDINAVAVYKRKTYKFLLQNWDYQQSSALTRHARARGSVLFPVTVAPSQHSH